MCTRNLFMKKQLNRWNLYDIESLSNAFTLCNYKEDLNEIDVYMLIDAVETIVPEMGDPSVGVPIEIQKVIAKRVYETNSNFRGKLVFHDLRNKSANEHLAKTFGMSDASSVNDPKSKSTYGDAFRPVCDTDKNSAYHIFDVEYDSDIHPYFGGYNSYNYDTTVLAYYLAARFKKSNGKNGYHFEVGDEFARIVRKFNNKLFDKYIDGMSQSLRHEKVYTNAQKIRQGMINSGRHVDIARLNEKQSKVALKRLLGTLGFQIMESDMLSDGKDVIETLDEIAELIAYNVSDVVNLAEVKNHPIYTGQMQVKTQMLNDYPELIYNQKKNGEYAPDISPDAVRFNRLTPDATSAKLATWSLCPYDHITDYEAVSFMYPSENISKQTGIPRVNVLEEAKKFYYANVKSEEGRAQFDNVYNYYKQFEGKNFNDSETYAQDFPELADSVFDKTQMPRVPMNVIYLNKDESKSEYYATFSYGGIHGAEYNKRLYEWDVKMWERQMETNQVIKDLFSGDIRNIPKFKDEFKCNPVYVASTKTLAKPLTKEDIDNYKAACDNKMSIEDAKLLIELERTKLKATLTKKEINDEIVRSRIEDDKEISERTVVQNATKKLRDMPVLHFEITRILREQKGKFKSGQIKKILTHRYEKQGVVIDIKGFAKPNVVSGGVLKKLSKGAILDMSYAEAIDAWIDIADEKPVLFKPKDNGDDKLRPRYTYTSLVRANHQDFESYYPNMLRMMEAFLNPGLGYDRYGVIFDQKAEFQKLRYIELDKIKDAESKLFDIEKDEKGNEVKVLKAFIEDHTKEELEEIIDKANAAQIDYNIKRNGVKLLLNAASGAGDSTFKSEVRINNKILSMRIIGQLFTWRVAQAQVFEGAGVPSTNTDGIYTVMEATIADPLLARVSDDIGVNIEPEDMYLITKDSNNRIELEAHDYSVISASGGSLSSCQDVSPSNNLTHPAIVDAVLAEYLTRCLKGDGVSIEKPMDYKIATDIIKELIASYDLNHAMRMMQNVIAASRSSYTYPVAFDATGKSVVLQHYNRMYFTDESKQLPAIENLSEQYTLKAVCNRTIPKDRLAKRERDNEQIQQSDPQAFDLLMENGVDMYDAPINREAVFKKVSGVDPYASVRIYNGHHADVSDDDKRAFLNALDLDRYVELAVSTYAKNWMNVVPDAV